MTTQVSRSTTPIHLEQMLREAEAQRERQLAGLRSSNGDLVADAHRASIVRILAEVRSALQRITAATYGDCTRCNTAISVERLELRPWAALCVRCAQR